MWGRCGEREGVGKEGVGGVWARGGGGGGEGRRT